MTKADLVNEVARNVGASKDDVATIVEAVMETIKESLIRKEDVFLRGFGSFIVKHRAAKTARNISKGISIEIPAHDIPAFKPSKEFMAKIK